MMAFMHITSVFSYLFVIANNWFIIVYNDPFSCNILPQFTKLISIWIPYFSLTILYFWQLQQLDGPAWNLQYLEQLHVSLEIYCRRVFMWLFPWHLLVVITPVLTVLLESTGNVCKHQLNKWIYKDIDGFHTSAKKWGLVEDIGRSSWSSSYTNKGKLYC